MSNFSERLEELIYENNLMPKQFAKCVALDVSIVYRYLRMESFPYIMHAIQIADFFKTSLDFLFGLTDNQEFVISHNSKNFHTRFQQILCDKNCTRYRLRKDLGLAHQSLEDWYHGKKLPTMANLILLANYFNCTLDFLSGRI